MRSPDDGHLAFQNSPINIWHLGSGCQQLEPKAHSRLLSGLPYKKASNNRTSPNPYCVRLCSSPSISFLMEAKRTGPHACIGPSASLCQIMVFTQSPCITMGKQSHGVLQHHSSTESAQSLGIASICLLTKKPLHQETTYRHSLLFSTHFTPQPSSAYQIVNGSVSLMRD